MCTAQALSNHIRQTLQDDCTCFRVIFTEAVQITSGNSENFGRGGAESRRSINFMPHGGGPAEYASWLDAGDGEHGTIVRFIANFHFAFEDDIKVNCLASLLEHDLVLRQLANFNKSEAKRS